MLLLHTSSWGEDFHPVQGTKLWLIASFWPLIACPPTALPRPPRTLRSNEKPLVLPSVTRRPPRIRFSQRLPKSPPPLLLPCKLIEVRCKTWIREAALTSRSSYGCPPPKKKSIYINLKEAGTQKGLSHQIFITDRGVKCWGGFDFNCLVTLRLAGVRQRKILYSPHTHTGSELKQITSKNKKVRTTSFHMKNIWQRNKAASKKRAVRNRNGDSRRLQQAKTKLNRGKCEWKLGGRLKQSSCPRSSGSLAREQPRLSANVNEKRRGVQRVIRPPSEDASRLRRDEAPRVIKCKCLLLSEKENFD